MYNTVCFRRGGKWCAGWGGGGNVGGCMLECGVFRSYFYVGKVAMVGNVDRL